MRKTVFLLALLAFSAKNSFAREANRRPILEYWKSPVMGAWRGIAYSTQFNTGNVSSSSALIQKYNLEFQFDASKRLVKGLFKGDTLPEKGVSRKIVRNRFKGEFHGTYELYTNGEIEINAVVFCKYYKVSYVFSAKFAGKVSDGHKKIRGSGSLRNSSGSSITLGFANFNKVKY